jgi:hypothetical protein
MEAVPFETSINFYETTRLSIPYILAALRTWNLDQNSEDVITVDANYLLKRRQERG